MSLGEKPSAYILPGSYGGVTLKYCYYCVILCSIQFLSHFSLVSLEEKPSAYILSGSYGSVTLKYCLFVGVLNIGRVH